MLKRLSKRYTFIYIIIWTLVLFTLFFHERQMLLEDFDFIEIPGPDYDERIADHIFTNLRAYIFVWIVGTSVILFFRSNFMKLVKRTIFVEHKLNYTIDKFKTVFDNAKDQMYLLEVKGDRKYFITDLNQSALEELGYSAEEIVDQPIEKILDETTTRRRAVRLEKILRGEQLTFEAVKIRKDGSKFPVEASVRLVKIGDKEFIHSVERNIQNRKHYEKEIIRAKIKAEESDRLKSAFLANMSHEIRTPMNGILGFTELLQTNNISEEKKTEYLEMINMSGKHLIKLINDIIDISKLEADKMSITKRNFKLEPFLQNIISFFEPLLKDDVKLTLETDLKDNEDVILSDDLRLKQVLTNLIGNSLKFTEKGFVHLSCVRENGSFLFKVQDTGIGMTEDELSIIFNRFRQADERTTKKYGGTGLGLAISQACVKLLGGNIWVESEKGKGSVFYFTIPYDKNESAELT